MKFRAAQASDLAAIERLWSDCFPGDELFYGFFASELFSPERSLLAVENGEVVSMVHFILQDVDYLGSAVPSAYIYGVGTAPDCRGRGIAGELMKFTFSTLKDSGVILALLVPQGKTLFDFYKRFGFYAAFSCGKAEEKRELFPNDYSACEAGFDEAMIPGMDHVFESNMIYRIHLRRNSEHWAHAAKVAELYGGGIITLAAESGMTGYSVCERDGEKLVISELFALDEPSYNALMAASMDRYGVRSALHYTPACPKDAADFGMARVLDAGYMLRLAAEYRGTMEFEFDLFDDILKDNNLRFKVGGSQVTSGEPSGGAMMTQAQFAEVLFGVGPLPYVNLLFS